MNEALDFKIKSLIKDQPKVAFEVLFENYYSLVARAAYMVTRSETIAEDLAQEVFTALWDKKEQIQSIKSLKGYLLVSIKNLSLNQIEKNKNRHSRENAYVELSSIAQENLPTENVKIIVEKMINNLAPRTRLVFTLSRFEGLSNDEISEYLSISKRTVETQVSLAMRSLRETARKNPSLIETLTITMLILIGLLLK